MEDAEVGAKWILIILVVFGMAVLLMAGGGMGMAMVSDGSCQPTGPGRTTCGDKAWNQVYGTFGLENPQTGQSAGW